jgi:hypothetical protein
MAVVCLRRETEYVSFDRPRAFRLLAHIIADLAELAGFPPIAEEEAKNEDAEAGRFCHRQRMAEPDPPPKRLSMRTNRPSVLASSGPVMRPGYERQAMPPAVANR